MRRRTQRKQRPPALERDQNGNIHCLACDQRWASKEPIEQFERCLYCRVEVTSHYRTWFLDGVEYNGRASAWKSPEEVGMIAGILAEHGLRLGVSKKETLDRFVEAHYHEILSELSPDLHPAAQMGFAGMPILGSKAPASLEVWREAERTYREVSKHSLLTGKEAP